jgi:hypothetical protein
MFICDGRVQRYSVQNVVSHNIIKWPPIEIGRTNVTYFFHISSFLCSWVSVRSVKGLLVFFVNQHFGRLKSLQSLCKSDALSVCAESWWVKNTLSCLLTGSFQKPVRVYWIPVGEKYSVLSRDRKFIKNLSVQQLQRMWWKPSPPPLLSMLTGQLPTHFCHLSEKKTVLDFLINF